MYSYSYTNNRIFSWPYRQKTLSLPRKKILNYARYKHSISILSTFPIGLIEPMEEVINVFKKAEDKISSSTNDLKSDDVLSIVRPELEKIGYCVEQNKKDEGKIKVPVLFGCNNSIDKHFYADAISADRKIVIEVEAGRATENHQFLKDIFEASMMFSVEYLVIAVRNIYRNHNDFERIYPFLETMYITNRIKLPLKGILLIGY